MLVLTQTHFHHCRSRTYAKEHKRMFIAITKINFCTNPMKMLSVFLPPSINKRDASDGGKTNRFTSLERGMKMKASHTLKTFSLRSSLLAGFSRCGKFYENHLSFFSARSVDRYVCRQRGIFLSACNLALRFFYHDSEGYPIKEKRIRTKRWKAKPQNDEKLLCSNSAVKVIRMSQHFPPTKT